LPNPQYEWNFPAEFEAADEAVQPKEGTAKRQPMAEEKEEREDLSDVKDEEIIPMDCNVYACLPIYICNKKEAAKTFILIFGMPYQPMSFKSSNIVN
jgi:hypothetical protein